MKKLSVVIVLYNEFDYIKRCIKSVLDEEIEDMELIIIDNNSKKEGFERLKSHYLEINNLYIFK